MLKNTFCHIPGVTARSEQRLWATGIHDWESSTRAAKLRVPRKAKDYFARCIEESFEHLEANNPNYFAAALDSKHHWRMFTDFRRSIAYLDIETTGLGYNDSITTIAVYDGKNIFHYVKGQNLDDFKSDINRYSLIVTYNGKCFDVPFIERYFRIKLNHAHIDLRYVLKSLGYTGGLKGCEQQLGIDRGGLAGVDGFFAVLLWQDYVRHKNEKALQTLLAYNVQDVVNLETLLVIAYNLKLNETPFGEKLRLSPPQQPRLPFQADAATIDKIKRANSWLMPSFRSRRW
ncbi:MAG TPA: ribonuclease H-like domain-containing protein [Blastocatellia bacterium]|nr:ribonuclease H-like domain-containing protein [Blastocatellia bacterium]